MSEISSDFQRCLLMPISCIASVLCALSVVQMPAPWKHRLLLLEHLHCAEITGRCYHDTSADHWLTTRLSAMAFMASNFCHIDLHLLATQGFGRKAL